MLSANWKQMTVNRIKLKGDYIGGLPQIKAPTTTCKLSPPILI